MGGRREGDFCFDMGVLHIPHEGSLKRKILVINLLSLLCFNYLLQIRSIMT